MNGIERLILVSCALVFWASGALADQPRLPIVTDQDRMRVPGNPVISPSGDLVAFSDDGKIFLAGEGTTAARALTSDAGSAWAPRWSSDGRHLYFLSDRSGVSQVWKLPVDRFGEAVQVTSREQGIPSGRLSPDETRIVIVLSDGEFAPAEAPVDGPPPPFVITRRHFKRDAGQGYLTAADTRHLYIHDIERNETAALTRGNFNQSGPAWAPDGKSIVYVSDEQPVSDAGYRSDIWLVSVTGGEAVRLTDSNAQKYAPAFSPDGETIAFLTAGDGVYSVPHIAVVPRSGGEPRILTKSLDRWIGSFEFSGNGRWIYFSFDNGGSTQVARVRVSDGRVERIVEGDVHVSAFDVGPGSTLALTLNGRNDLPDVYLAEGKRLTRLTELNREFLAELRIGDKKKVSFQSADGTVVEAFLTFPPDYEADRRWPAILNIHGGPVGQYNWGYDFPTQFLAANGYVVIEPNPRGSSGFGEDYIRAIYRTWGITDFDDVMAAVDYAVDEGIADPDRLAVTGYSYGGYMTNVVITGTDRFKAAASGAGHSLIEANFGHDIYQEWYVWELGTPWEHRERYDVLSPFLRVGKVTTPTLFLGGRIDWNVPILNAELMYQALRVRGIDTELVVYPDAHHGGWPAEYEQDYLSRLVAWFDRYLGD